MSGDEVARMAGRVRTMAGEVEEAGGEVRPVELVDWSGEAADAFGAASFRLRERVIQAADAVHEVAGSLDRLAVQVDG